MFYHEQKSTHPEEQVECFLNMQDASFGVVFCQKHSTTGASACPFYVSEFILQLTIFCQCSLSKIPLALFR